jgi:hypothetical protein
MRLSWCPTDCWGSIDSLFYSMRNIFANRELTHSKLQMVKVLAMLNIRSW